MYDVLYSNTIQKCPLILYWIYQLQHSVSLHLTASFMKHRLRVRCTSINSLNVLMNSSSHASLIYTNRQSSSRKSRHQKNRNRNIQVNCGHYDCTYLGVPIPMRRGQRPWPPIQGVVNITMGPTLDFYTAWQHDNGLSATRGRKLHQRQKLKLPSCIIYLSPPHSH